MKVSIHKSLMHLPKLLVLVVLFGCHDRPAPVTPYYEIPLTSPTSTPPLPENKTPMAVTTTENSEISTPTHNEVPSILGEQKVIEATLGRALQSLDLVGSLFARINRSNYSAHFSLEQTVQFIQDKKEFLFKNALRYVMKEVTLDPEIEDKLISLMMRDPFFTEGQIRHTLQRLRREEVRIRPVDSIVIPFELLELVLNDLKDKLNAKQMILARESLPFLIYDKRDLDSAYYGYHYNIKPKYLNLNPTHLIMVDGRSGELQQLNDVISLSAEWVDLLAPQFNQNFVSNLPAKMYEQFLGSYLIVKDLEVKLRQSNQYGVIPMGSLNPESSFLMAMKYLNFAEDVLNSFNISKRHGYNGPGKSNDFFIFLYTRFNDVGNSSSDWPSSYLCPEDIELMAYWQFYRINQILAGNNHQLRVYLSEHAHINNMEYYQELQYASAAEHVALSRSLGLPILVRTRND